MEYFYILFALIVLGAECSTKIDTNNIFKKISLLLIVLGCLISMSGSQNNLIIYGAFLYVAVDLWKKYTKGSESNELHKRQQQ